MIRHRLRIGQTAATVLAEAEYIPIAREEVRRCREQLLEFIERNPGFRTALRPMRVPESAPEIVRRMAAASARVGVGPMAAVAGAVGASAVRAMCAAGAAHAVFDNGGDIAMKIDRPTVIGLRTGDGSPVRLGFRFPPSREMFGVCTSSAVIGHSLSFGRAEAAMVAAAEPELADAAATALGNRVTEPGREAVERALAGMPGEGIRGMLVAAGGFVGRRGDLPELCRIDGPGYEFTPV